MKINREEFLVRLQSVEAGLSSREVVEQSDCFVFGDGRIQTYNDEMAVSVDSPIPDFNGAVQAAPLLQILQKLTEDDINVDEKDGRFVIRGVKKKSGIVMHAEVTLPVENVEKPDEWKKLPEGFCEAVGIVQVAAGKDDGQFCMTCVHMAEHFLEACDNHQLIRYKMDTNISEDTLIRRDSIKHIATLDMTEVAETTAWIHFRNPRGVVLSCRRWAENYPDMSALLEGGGDPTTLPSSMAEAVDKAEVFSSDNSNSNQVTIQLKADKMRINGEGAGGYYEEIKNIKYKGEPIEFMISPKLLLEVTKRSNECLISPGRLKIDGGKFVFVSCLGVVE